MSDSHDLEALKIRLYLDRHIMKRLALDLRNDGFNVLTTEEAQLDFASDEDQLSFATQQNRAIVTFNIRDFAPLHATWQTQGRVHSGIIVSQQLGRRQYHLLLTRMKRLLDHFAGSEMQANLVHLEQFK